MKATILSVLMLCSILVVSCHKEKGERIICNESECAVCMDENFQNNDEIDGYAPGFIGDRMIERTIISPLVRASSCNYIVSGKIKYTYANTGETAAILDYGDGTVDAWAVKTIYPTKEPKGRCGIAVGGCFGPEEKASTECCKFEQKCNELVNAAITIEAETVNN